MLPAEVDRTVARYLADADHHLPGLTTALHVVGPVALGAYRPGRSDVDVVVVLSRPPSQHDLAGLRRLQLRSGARTAGSRCARATPRRGGVLGPPPLLHTIATGEWCPRRRPGSTPGHVRARAPPAARRRPRLPAGRGPPAPLTRRQRQAGTVAFVHEVLRRAQALAGSS